MKRKGWRRALAMVKYVGIGMLTALWIALAFEVLNRWGSTGDFGPALIFAIVTGALIGFTYYWTEVRWQI